MRNLKVHHIYSRSLDNNGGPSKSLRRFKNNSVKFESAGLSYLLFTPESFNEYTKSEKSKSLKSTVRKLLKGIIEWIKPSALFFVKRIIHEKYLRNSHNHIQKYLSHHHTLDADIYVFNYAFDCYFFLKGRPKGGYRVVLFQHNSGSPLSMLEEYYPSIKGTDFKQKLSDKLKWTYQQVDRMIFIAENGLKAFRGRNYGIPDDRLGFFHNGIDDYEKNEEESIRDLVNSKNYFNYRLVCAGTINSRKAQYLILEAFAKLSISDKELFHFTLLGDGPDRKRLLEKIEQNQWGDHFDLPGAVSNVTDYLKKSNLYILVSMDEGLPISIIEAEKMGLPIIGTNVAGIPEMINEGENGFLLNPDSDELVTIFENLANYDLKSMGLNSIDIFKEKFTFSKMINGFIQELKKLQ